MKWLLIFTLIFALLGCTGGPKNQAKLEVSAAFLDANLSAGLMLYVINKDKNTQRSIKLIGNTTTVQLEDGNWDFAVLAWDGTSPMSGNLQCAKASRTFKNSNEEIRLTLGVSDCNSDFFAPAVYRSSTIKKLDLVNCTSTSSITSAGSPCSKGPALSYKVKLLAHRERAISDLPSLSMPILPKLETGCLTLNNSSSITSTNLTIPFGSQAFHPPTIIETYTDAGCNSGKQTLFFPDGLAQAETSQHHAKSFAGTSPPTGVVFFDYGALHVADTNSFSPALVGGPAQTKLITLNNYSGSSINNISWTLSSGEFSFTGGGNCGATLTATQSTCNLEVQFNPTTGGLKQSTLTISFSLPNGQTKTITSLLSGNGVGFPLVTSSVATIDFGQVIQNQTPAPKSVTVTFNNGTGPNISTMVFSINGQNASKFTPTSNCTATGTVVICTVSIAFNDGVSPVYGNFEGHKLLGQYSIGGTLYPATPFNIVPTISASEIATGVVSPFYTSNSLNVGTVDYWNIYANDSQPYQTGSNGECIPGSHSICQHRGDKRVTVLPSEFNSCDNLVGKDILDVFKWECYLNGTTVKFRIKEFNPGKGLKDLIDPNSSEWKPIQFKAFNDSTVVYQTAQTTWWSNPIQKIDGLDGFQYGDPPPLTNVLYVSNIVTSQTQTLNSFKLDNAGMIYVHTSDLNVPSIHIGNSNVSLVSLGSAIIKSNNNSDIKYTCSESSGILNAPDIVALICAGGGNPSSNHSWIEVKAEGKQFTNNFAVFLAKAAFSRVHNSTIIKDGTGIKIYKSEKPNMITQTEISENKFDGMKIQDSYSVQVDNLKSTYNDRYGIIIENALLPNFISRSEVSYNKSDGIILLQSSKVFLNSIWSFKNDGNGIHLEDSDQNRIHGSISSFNKQRGVYYKTVNPSFPTKNNILHDSMIANNCTETASSGFGTIEYDEAKSNNAYNLVVTANACYGLIISNPAPPNLAVPANYYDSLNTFLNLTLTNNANGIYLDNAFYNTFVNVIASNTTLNNNSYTNGAGLFLSYSNYNNFTNFVTTNNNTGVDFQNSNSNTFTNAFLTGNNYQVSTSQDCIIDVISSNNTLTNSTGQNDCSSAITKPGKNLVNAFVGKVDSDEKNQDNTAYKANTHSYLGESSILDFINFSNPFRYWANNTTVFPYDSPFNPSNASMCDGGDCAIWDWRLKTTDSDIKNKTGNGASSNGSFVTGNGNCINILKGGEKISDSQSPGNTFLFRAFEIAFDGIGDDDGLCESSEECIYSPHFGAYQGEGNPMTTSCTPSSGNPNDLTGYKIYAYPTNGGL